MKLLLIISILAMSLNLCAQEKYLAIKAKVYQLNQVNIEDEPLVDLLNKATLLYEPSMFTYIGEDASMEINGEDELLRLEVNSSKEELTYTINLSTKEKQDGGWLTMSYESPAKTIGLPSLIKSSLWQQHLIIQIDSELLDELNLPNN